MPAPSFSRAAVPATAEFSPVLSARCHRRTATALSSRFCSHTGCQRRYSLNRHLPLSSLVVAGKTQHHCRQCRDAAGAATNSLRQTALDLPRCRFEAIFIAVVAAANTESAPCCFRLSSLHSPSPSDNRFGEIDFMNWCEGATKHKQRWCNKVLTDEAEGLKFKLTDAVDIGPDGTLYFTDASSKYSIEHAFLDMMDGRPHGRFLSYDPSTKQTTVL
ncbi:hypothetical protein SASPL_154725 [Salvia splendens]|uniref:Strictosidine synthase conserved region domain-containing protein n=1 Tax=Salvia splendens TaxID=180675 RepID=A0A8X8YZI4_SALSN|nr:hypothetical protein SASPL_154725 [Salvia splendens]